MPVPQILVDFGFFPFSVQTVDTTATVKDRRGYVYANLDLPMGVTATAGVTYVDFDRHSSPDLSVNEVSPKFGVQWQATSAIRLRAAYTETVKPPIELLIY